MGLGKSWFGATQWVGCSCARSDLPCPCLGSNPELGGDRGGHQGTFVGVPTSAVQIVLWYLPGRTALQGCLVPFACIIAISKGSQSWSSPAQFAGLFPSIASGPRLLPSLECFFRSQLRQLDMVPMPCCLHLFRLQEGRGAGFSTDGPSRGSSNAAGIASSGGAVTGARLRSAPESDAHAGILRAVPPVAFVWY